MADLIVEADGGSRGNPGVAGYGALVRSAATGRVLAERAAPLGKASNNVAEYTGLIEGLRAAAEIDPGAAIEVRMDSKLVVEQMAGRWKIKHEDMRRLAREAGELVAHRTAAGGSVAYTWIPRAANAAADRLSNVGMDGETVSVTYGEADGAAPGDGDGAADADGEGDGDAEKDADAAGATEARGATEKTPPGGVPATAPAPATAPTPAPAPVPRGAAAARVRRGAAPPDLAAPARFLLVRHGPTEATAAGLLDGRGGSDAPLTAEGQRQCVATGHALRRMLRDGPAPLLVSSTLRRARQSAAAIGGVLTVAAEADAAWDEQHFGDWEGQTVAQVCATAEGAAAYARLRSDAAYARPGGESRADLARRVVGAFDDLAMRSRDEGRPIVVVSHRAALLAVLDALLGLSSPWSLALAPASLTALRQWADGVASVDFVNDQGHLRG